MRTPESWLEDLLERYPQLVTCKQSIWEAYVLMRETVIGGGTLLICGNGGSCADSAHITGELLKGFMLPRPLGSAEVEKLERVAGEDGVRLAKKLQKAIPAVDLTANIALMTAVANDIDADMIFAQQLMAYSNSNNLVLGISPIGMAKNIINAFYVAKMLGIKTISFTGSADNDVARLSDVAIMVPQQQVYLAQELHLPVYHTLCMMLEAQLYG